MSVKDRLRAQMEKSRTFTEELLKEFETPEQWTHQVHDRANHALWFAGHMAVTDNFLIRILSPDQSLNDPEYQGRFGMGSQPTTDPNDYPTPESVVNVMRERRSVLLRLLDEIGEAELNDPTPEGAPDFLPDYCSVFEMAAWHEALHAGQITIAHRSLGNSPITGRKLESPVST